MATLHTHCSYCGAAFPAGLAWPRTCPTCHETTWRNPLPVAVALLPVRTADIIGLVVLRRDIEPGRGLLALPGGYVEYGEDWRTAVVRELREETGLHAEADHVTLFDVHSTGHTVNVFGLLPPRDAAGMPASAPTSEATEWLVVTEPLPLAFPTHERAVESFFARWATPGSSADRR